MKKYRLRNGDIVESDFEFSPHMGLQKRLSKVIHKDGTELLFTFTGDGHVYANGGKSSYDIIEEITDKPKYVIKAGVTVEEIGRAMCSHFGTKFSEAGRENDEKALLKAGLLEEKRQHKFNHELAKEHYDRRLTEGTLPVSKPELQVDNCLMCNFTLNARSGGVCFHPDKKINGPCPKGGA